MHPKIIHCHVHKTAGTSINRWLELLVAAEQARTSGEDDLFSRRWNAAPHSPPPATGPLDPLHAELGREARAYWDVIHGHSAALATAETSPYRFVILREPASRFVSFLKDWRRLPDSALEGLPADQRALRLAARTLDAGAFARQFLDTPTLHALRQTHALRAAAAYALPAGRFPDGSASDLEMAVAALDELFDFVGVFEQLDRVVHCIARDLGAAPPPGVGVLNAGLTDPARDVIDAEGMATLRRLWADDFAVYEHAVRRFHERAGSAPDDYSEEAFERSHLAARLAQLSPRRTPWGRVFSLNDQVVGAGFLGRERPGSAAVAAWTGPLTRSVLYVPVPAGERLDLFLDLDDWITDAVRSSLRVQVDGRPAALTTRPGRWCRERLWIPATTTRPFVKLEILVDRTFTSAEAGGKESYHGKRGVALAAYGYRLTPPPGQPNDRYPGEAVLVAHGEGPLEDDGHPDREWAVAFGNRLLARLGPDSSEEDVLALLTLGVPDRELRAVPTQAGVEEAFRRTLRRPPPREWLDFWVGKRRFLWINRQLTLRQLYLDLIRGEDFRKLRGRL
jgi:hypothetical protein